MNLRYLWPHLVAAVLVLTLAFAVYSTRARLAAEDNLTRARADIQKQEEKLDLYRTADLTNMPPFLHHDHGAAYVYVAMGPELHEIEAIQEYMVDIFRREDPHNPLEWEAHVIDHGVECDDEYGFQDRCTVAIARYGAFSVVVPGLSMPGMASLCRVLRHYYGWDWPHESPHMPESVKKSVHYPGRADLMCEWSYYHRQEIPWWFVRELSWQSWDIDLIEEPEWLFDPHNGIDDEDWTDSPWRRRPK